MNARLAAPSTVFAAPDDNTAAEPPERRGLRRDEVRLLVAGRHGIVHRLFRDLPDQLRPGDLLVVNTSATVAAEIDGQVSGRGPVVVHFATHLDDGHWVVELRSAPDACCPILDGRAARWSACPTASGSDCSRRTRRRVRRRPVAATGCGGRR